MRSLLVIMLLLVGVDFAVAECVAPNMSGQKVIAREARDPELRDFWASSSYDQNGHPIISYGALFSKLPPVVQRFSRLHECGHLVNKLSPDEFEANCYALKAGRFSKRQVAEIADYFKQMPVLGLEYGGSGAAFWAGTVRRCPELADPDN